jgi:hypothetical protein
MAYNFNGTDQHLTVASTPVTSVPLTLACWFNPDSITTNGVLLQIHDGTALNRFGLVILGTFAGDPVRAACIQGGLEGSADSTTGYTAGTMQHACGVFASNSSRTVFLNGGSSATSTSLIAPSGVNAIDIGRRLNSGVGGLFFDGKLAEVGIWNAALTAAEVASLARGMTCDKVRPQNLVFYAPLVRDLIDQKGGLAITNNNGATVANHPRVYA